MKSKTTAGVLAFFLGGLGGHKFYLGQTGMGLLYFFFCWTYIPTLVSFVEALMLFTMDDNKFDLKYNPAQLAQVNLQRALPAPHAPVQPVAQSVVVNIPSASPPSPNLQPQPRVNLSDELRKLHDLQVAGILTPEEFDAQKKRLLGQ